MARLLSQTLIRRSTTSQTPSSFTTLRSRSSAPDAAVEIVDLDAADVDLVGGIRKLEDAIHGIVVRRSAPVWLPFRPGSSYWVPPRRKGYSHGLVDLVGKIANPMTDDEMMALTTIRGWPSSSFFIEGRRADGKGFNIHQFEDNQEVYIVKTDEEA